MLRVSRRSRVILMLCPRRLKRLSDVSTSDWCDLEVFLMHLYDEKLGITKHRIRASAHSRRLAEQDGVRAKLISSEDLYGSRDQGTSAVNSEMMSPSISRHSGYKIYSYPSVSMHYSVLLNTRCLLEHHYHAAYTSLHILQHQLNQHGKHRNHI
jgi:hypothetical protein